MSIRHGLVLVAVVLAGCGTEEPPPLASPDAFGEQPVDWYLISADDAQIRIGYHMSGIASDCERAGPVEVDETPDAVTINAHKLVTTEQKACTEELQLYEETLELDAPLGDRELRGCMPTADLVDENATCRDLDRSRQGGYLQDF